MTKGRIAFQGELGANSHEASLAAYPEMEPVPCATFEEAFEAVRSGDCRLGMIPVENSIAGRVADVHHLLPSSGLRIIGERFKPIHFQLMVNPGVKLEDVKPVASMPIALGQCRKSLRRMGLKTEPVGDTALAAKCEEARTKFKTAMDDDLNTPDALAAVFDLVKEINTLSASSTKEALEAAAKAFDEITDVLGLMYNRRKDEVPAEVTELVEKRAAAKKAKDWATADAIRAQLTEMGWAVKDTAQGPQLSKL